MTFLQAMILWSLQKINGERTVYSIYHLLKGKKSSQTIQDAHFFKLESLFQTLPFLHRQTFDQEIKALVKRSYITIDSEQRAFLSNEGLALLQFYFQKTSFHYLNGLKYHDTATLFWKRLSLMVQVISNLISGNRNYYPIQREMDIQIWMKTILRQYINSKQQLSSKLYKELFDIFSQEPPEDPELIVIRFTGHQQIGKTIEQSAEHFRIETTEYWYRFLHLLHFILESIVVDPVRFPLLFSLIADSYQTMPLTKSTNKTYQLLKQGYKIEKIASIRQLKESTIEDHIIEIALNDPTLNIEAFLDMGTERRIAESAASLGYKKLKPIKECVGNVTYFQIRLALAKKGV